MGRRVNPVSLSIQDYSDDTILYGLTRDISEELRIELQQEAKKRGII